MRAGYGNGYGNEARIGKGDGNVLTFLAVAIALTETGIVALAVTIAEAI